MTVGDENAVLTYFGSLWTFRNEMFAPLSGRGCDMGSETRLEAPLGKGLLSSLGMVCSLLVFTRVAFIQVSVGNNLPGLL